MGIFVTPETLPRFPAGNTDDLFDVDLLDGLVGMLQRCAIDVDFENPWNSALVSLQRGEAASMQVENKNKKKRQTSTKDVSAKLSPEVVDRATSAARSAAGADSSHDQLLPPVLGFALVRGVALCNHSCDPNVVLEWAGRAECVARARRPIQLDEEVLMSYLGVDDLERNSLQQRRDRLLEGWGFLCQCARCTAEAQGGPWLCTRGGEEPVAICQLDGDAPRRKGKRQKSKVDAATAGKPDVPRRKGKRIKSKFDAATHEEPEAPCRKGQRGKPKVNVATDEKPVASESAPVSMSQKGKRRKKRKRDAGVGPVSTALSKT